METVFKRILVFINNKASLLKEYTIVHWEAKNSVKTFCFLYNICNCFTEYKNWRYRWNFNVIQKVNDNGPIDFCICAFVIKNITFLIKLIFVLLIRSVHTLDILLSSAKI